MEKEYDLIVFGATGFTGRLVADYVNRIVAAGEPLRWAMAARSLDKLAQVRTQIGAPPQLALIAADACDARAMAELVAKARVVITTVGPYQLHGEALVSACAHAGTDYVDLCGEPVWMARMIPKLQAAAEASGARIVFSCGFDSIPFDLGVLFLQHAAQERFGQALARVHGRVRVMKGGVSGGTIASALATIEQIGRDTRLTRIMADPFALTPGFRGPAQPDGELAAYDALAKSWSGPFVMAVINTKNLHRSNFLLDHAWGRDFCYDERMLSGDGETGRRRAVAMQRKARLQAMLLGFGPTRALLQRFALPKPGQGPSARQRETGCYELLFIGQGRDGQILRTVVTGDRDPGYGSTAKMLAQSALCLMRDIPRSLTRGGVWTPGASMGLALIERLQQHAGLRFVIEG